MKKMTLAFAAIILTISSFAQNWKIDPAHTKIHFNAKYLVISETEGEFKTFEGVFYFFKAGLDRFESRDYGSGK